MMKKRKPLPREMLEFVQTRIPAPMKELMLAEAEKKYISVGAYLRQIIAKELGLEKK